MLLSKNQEEAQLDGRMAETRRGGRVSAGEGAEAGGRLFGSRQTKDFEMRKFWKKHLTAAVICDWDILVWLSFPARPELALLSQLIEGPL